MEAKDILLGANLKPTAGRLAVFSVLRAGECLAAADILQRLERKPHIPPATAYRALAALCEAGLAVRVPATNGALYMLAQDAATPHLICSRCGKVEEVDSPEVRRYNMALMKNRGVSGDSALLMLADCKRKECAD